MSTWFLRHILLLSLSLLLLLLNVFWDVSFVIVQELLDIAAMSIFLRRKKRTSGCIFCYPTFINTRLLYSVRVLQWLLAVFIFTLAFHFTLIFHPTSCHVSLYLGIFAFFFDMVSVCVRDSLYARTLISFMWLNQIQLISIVYFCQWHYTVCVCECAFFLMCHCVDDKLLYFGRDKSTHASFFFFFFFFMDLVCLQSLSLPLK